MKTNKRDSRHIQAANSWLLCTYINANGDNIMTKLNELTNAQAVELKTLVANYRAECKAFDEHMQRDDIFSSIETLLDYSESAKDALADNLGDLGLPLNTDTVDAIEEL